MCVILWRGLLSKVDCDKKGVLTTATLVAKKRRAGALITVFLSVLWSFTFVKGEFDNFNRAKLALVNQVDQLTHHQVDDVTTNQLMT